jgi:HEAT repeat protein
MNALDDQSSSVRGRACQAIHQMDEKLVTTEVIGKVVDAFVDEDVNVRVNACRVLRKMSEKITSEMISKLIIPLNGDNLNDSHDVAELIGNSLNSSSMISELGPSTILELCLSKFGSICLKNVSEEQLIQLFLADRISSWLPAITKLTLVRETAVTATEEKIVVYGRKEPLELVISGTERQQLVEAFRDQGKKLHLFSGVSQWKVVGAVMHPQFLTILLFLLPGLWTVLKSFRNILRSFQKF